jgi:hypothetical protein
MSDLETKFCPKCQKIKNKDDYQPSQFNRKGAWCRDCKKKYYQENREDALAYAKEYRKNQDKEKVAEYNKNYRKENKKELAEQKKIYYQDNKEIIEGKRKIYYQENKKDISKRAKIYREKNKEKLLEEAKIYYQENKEERLEYRRQYYQGNKEKILEKDKEYKRQNKKYYAEYYSQYYQKNKEKKNKQNNECNKKRRKNDPEFKLRTTMSTAIYQGLKSNGSSKKGQSIVQFLPYLMHELKKHIETLFSAPYNLTLDGKVWMNWKNWGKYNAKKWKDDDPSTWTWQLDHIIPHSTFHYTTMDCQEFRDCWALSNLRPLSAKQNYLDGVKRTRH